MAFINRWGEDASIVTTISASITIGKKVHVILAVDLPNTIIARQARIFPISGSMELPI